MPSSRAACPFLLLLAACGSAPRWSLVDPGMPSAEQRQQLAEAERHYRAREPFDELRAQIVADPVTAWWYSRMVVRDVVTTRDGKITASEQRNAPIRALPDFLAEGKRVDPGDSDPLLRAVAGKRDPVQERALEEIDRLGAVAVPCLIFDLARHTQGYVRQIGVELLGRVGAPALPAIEQHLVASADPVHRRTAAQAIAAMPADAATFAHLRRLTADADYGVRGAAYLGFATAGPDACPLLRRALFDDADPFVRRSVAKALGAHRQAASAQALVAYLQRCKTERDAEGVDAAQEALQELAGVRGVRSVDAWRAWAATFAPGD